MKIITSNSKDLFILKPIPPEWENLRRKVASQAGRHAIIAGGAIRDHILGLPVKDIDIFVLGMSAEAAKQIFGAEIIEYAGVEEAKHQYRTPDGLTVDLIFSRHDNVHEVLEQFDLGICRVAWDGWDYVVTDDFEFDHRYYMIGFEFRVPYLHETPFEEEPDDRFCADTADKMYRWFAFDVPEAVVPYSPRRDTIEPGSIAWELGYELEEFLRKWAIAILNLTLTAKGNLKKPDQEHLDRCIRRLRVKIETDLGLWLENDPRYQELIRDRVNETIQNFVKTHRETETAAA
jgi:Poly A polymerase head domain